VPIVICSGCTKRLQVKDSRRGSVITCPICAAPTSVPLSEPTGDRVTTATGDQFYVTHCTTEDSLLNTPGYSVRAASTTDRAALLLALEYPPYELPIDLWKDRPSKADTPCRLTRTTHPSGGVWVAHSVFLEEDTMGRDRSYFTHLIHLPASTGPASILRSWGATAWVKESPPKADKKLSEGRLPVGTAISDESLSAFLSGSQTGSTDLAIAVCPTRLRSPVGRHARRELVGRFLKGVILATRGNELRDRLFVHAEPGLVAMLTYAAVRILPPSWMVNLTFTTFEPAHRGLRDYKLATVIGTYQGEVGEGLTPDVSSLGYGLDTFHPERSSAELPGPLPEGLAELVELAAGGEWRLLAEVHRQIGTESDALGRVSKMLSRLRAAKAVPTASPAKPSKPVPPSPYIIVDEAEDSPPASKPVKAKPAMPSPSAPTPPPRNRLLRRLVTTGLLIITTATVTAAAIIYFLQHPKTESAAVSKSEPDSTPADPPLPAPMPKAADVPPSDPPNLLPKAGDIVRSEIAPGVFMDFCWVPSGEAQLGSPKAEQDYLTRTYIGGTIPAWLKEQDEILRGKFKTTGFWLGKYEVMQKEWMAVMGDNPSEFDGKKANKAKGLNTSRFPVERVSFQDCQKFLEEVNKRSDAAKVFGQAGQFVLPDENEWEYACRGGKGNNRMFYWGTELNGTQANCDGTHPCGTTRTGPSLGRTAQVGSYERDYPHPWGLCDMSGNVWEWCEVIGKASSDSRRLRGGCWFGYSLDCRTANQGGRSINDRDPTGGFRVCFKPAPPESAEVVVELERHLTASRDPDAAVRRSAAVGLGTFLVATDVSLRRKAAQALATLGADAEPALVALRNAVKDKDDDVRKAARRALDKLDEIAAAATAAAKAREEADKAEEAARLREAILALVKDLNAKEPADRIKALEKIAAYGTAANIIGEHLIGAMIDPVPEVRDAAAGALEKVNPTVYPHVFTLLRGQFKATALTALGKLGDKAKITLPLLFDLLAKSDAALATPPTPLRPGMPLPPP